MSRLKLLHRLKVLDYIRSRRRRCSVGSGRAVQVRACRLTSPPRFNRDPSAWAGDGTIFTPRPVSCQALLASFTPVLSHRIMGPPCPPVVTPPHPRGPPSRPGVAVPKALRLTGPPPPKPRPSKRLRADCEDSSKAPQKPPDCGVDVLSVDPQHLPNPTGWCAPNPPQSSHRPQALSGDPCSHSPFTVMTQDDHLFRNNCDAARVISPVWMTARSSCAAPVQLPLQTRFTLYSDALPLRN